MTIAEALQGSEPEIGPKTDLPVPHQPGGSTVFVRQVTWKEKASELRLYVVWSPSINQVLVANTTNDIFWAQGRLIEPVDGPSAIALKVSKALPPFSPSELEEKRMAWDAVQHRSLGRQTARISLGRLLSKEREANRLANPPSLKVTDIGEIGTNYIVRFETFLHRKGQVILDRELDVVQMGLEGTPLP